MAASSPSKLSRRTNRRFGLARLFRLFDAAIAPLILIGEIVVAVMCLHIVAEIVANAVFASPIEGTPEVVANWYMVAIVFLPLALIHRRDGHIKAELFTDKLGAAPRALLDVATNLLMAGFAVLLAWYSFGDALDATARGDRIELMRGAIDIWPTRWLVPLGFGGTALVALLTAIRRAADLGRASRAGAR